ncbi:YolD-like family protein [Psychrobacillus vulpis]|uniref:YolD-like family protein n=1 Tax=Psychrobacillus vulpis TaxID=2325572 RepID=A0A544TQ81_9BACI|nr:YolD-like family protein [Psychrobacillus vulpis]TQR19614.1 YolD-like family protein [Psychrobacillus vulpis]
MVNYEEEWSRLDLSKVQDRGSKKWVSMMLPEHVKMLRDFNVTIKKVPCPNLNEFDYEAIQEQIELAMKRNVEIKIIRWRNGELLYNQGAIQWIDLTKRTIELEDPFSSFELLLDEIVDATIME